VARHRGIDHGFAERVAILRACDYRGTAPHIIERERRGIRVQPSGHKEKDGQSRGTGYAGHEVGMH